MWKVSEVIEYAANNMLSPMFHIWIHYFWLIVRDYLLVCASFSSNRSPIVSCEPVGSHDVRAWFDTQWFYSISIYDTIDSYVVYISKYIWVYNCIRSLFDHLITWYNICIFKNELIYLLFLYINCSALTILSSPQKCSNE